MEKSIKKSIDDAGGVAFIAAHFEITSVSVYEWIKRGYVPPEKCVEIEKLSGGSVLCEELNANVDWSYLRNKPELAEQSEPSN